MNSEGNRFIDRLALFITLLVFWFLVSGTIDLQHLIAGAISALLVSWFWKGLLRRVSDRHDILPYRLLFTFTSITYVFHLMFQVIKANIAVAMVVLNPRLPISPVVLRTTTKLKHDLTRVAFAHSITLTPGTVTLSLTGDRLVIHALTARSADPAALDDLEKWIIEIERRLTHG